MEPHRDELPRRVLVVEDEPRLLQGIVDNLEAEGYEVAQAADAHQLNERCKAFAPELIILDVMLPGRDGLSACEDLRASGNTTPVLFLTARNLPEERVRGLEVGGDDYLGKPFVLDELLGRVAALMRRARWSERASSAGPEQVRLGGTQFDFRRFEVVDGRGHKEPLPAREAQILRLLVQRRGEVVSREDILDEVWGADVLPSSRTVDNFIVRLRRRFEDDPAVPQLLHTVRGVGYRLSEAQRD